MRTVTFDTQIHDGMIQVPKKYKNLDARDIEVVLIIRNSEADAPKRIKKPGKTARGILRKYKNPALIPGEKTAWEIAVNEKYAHR